MIDLNTIWFLLVGVLIVGYGILDGFDLGVGVLSLFSRDHREKRLFRNAIGPVWDGNEVWLLTAGGALFAAFPPVYATVFSGFYLAFMLLLLALIFRAVSLEFYSQVDSPTWRWFWSWAFGLGSLVPALLYGVAFGNVLRGVPITADVQYQGTFLGLLNPYALLVGLLSLSLFIMHGAIYMTNKTDGPFRDRMRAWAMTFWVITAGLHLVATASSIRVAPHLFEGLLHKPLFYVVLLPLLVAIPGVPAALSRRWHGWAFIASSVTIAGMVGMAGVSLYPRLVISSLAPENSLTIYNASSTALTLKAMLIIALIGVPLVLAYTACMYWIFRGKANAAEEY